MMQHSETATHNTTICNRKKFQWNWISNCFRIVFISMDSWAPLCMHIKYCNPFGVCVCIDWNEQTHFILLSLGPDVLSSEREIQRLLSQLNNPIHKQCQIAKNNNKCRQNQKNVYGKRNVNLHSTQNNTSNNDKW